MATDGTPYPVYHVFEALSSFSTAIVVRTTSTRPLGVPGLCLRDGRRERMLVANLTDGTQMVRLRGLPLQARIRAIRPDGSAAGDVPGSGELELRLDPFAIYAIDGDRP